MNSWRQFERLMRSRVLSSPFLLTKLLTRFEIEGREHLEQALARQRLTGQGLVTISNHLSLFDDPLMLFALMGGHDYNVETKRWWSTPCESNFNPRGKGFGPSFVRYFGDVSNMVFFARPSKKGRKMPVPSCYVKAIKQRGGPQLVQRISDHAGQLGLDAETYLRRFVTLGVGDAMAPLNQAGMVEACARIETGDWLHFFPEGTRSRTLELKRPKRGVGKIIYHCADVDVLPICFYGTQDIMPVGAKFPRPFKRVVVSVGEPIPAARLAELRRRTPCPETYQAVTEAAFESVHQLRVPTLARYLQGQQQPAAAPVPVQDTTQLQVKWAEQLQAARAENKADTTPELPWAAAAQGQQEAAAPHPQQIPARYRRVRR